MIKQSIISIGIVIRGVVTTSITALNNFITGTSITTSSGDTLITSAWTKNQPSKVLISSDGFKLVSSDGHALVSKETSIEPSEELYTSHQSEII